MLEVAATVLGKPGFIYPTVLWDEKEVVLVDTGFPGQVGAIKAALDEAGLTGRRLTRIIITHQDIDHVGGLPDLLRESADGLEVLCHEEERPYLVREREPAKLAKLEANRDSLPEPMKQIYQGMKRFYGSLRVDIDRTLADGERLPWCGGIQVIFTPGHTPGHICLYHESSKTLVAGDALAVEEGRLVRAAAFTNLDTTQATQSLVKLADYDIQAAICYHGGLYACVANRRIAELAAE